MTNEQLSMDDALAAIPITPYAGTGGWSGSETSRDRAIREANSGELTKRQHDALSVLAEHPDGLVWSDLAGILNLHHGQISSVLSNLHHAGVIFQTLTPRNRCLPYVHGKFRDRHNDRRDEPIKRAQTIPPQAQQVIHETIDDLIQRFGFEFLTSKAYENLTNLVTQTKKEKTK